MVKVILNYKGVETEIQCNLNEKIKDIFKRYSNKVEVDISKVYFIYNGNKIDDNNLILNGIINEEDKRRNIMNILVNIIIIKLDNNCIFILIFFKIYKYNKL